MRTWGKLLLFFFFGLFFASVWLHDHFILCQNYLECSALVTQKRILDWTLYRYAYRYLENEENQTNKDDKQQSSKSQ